MQQDNVQILALAAIMSFILTFIRAITAVKLHPSVLANFYIRGTRNLVSFDVEFIRFFCREESLQFASLILKLP